MTPEASYLIDHVERSISDATQGRSQLTAFHMAVEGMSSVKGRHLFNNLCAARPRSDALRYLEVGSWKGSLLCAATFSNPIEAVAIDDFSQFADTTFGTDRRHPRQAVQENLALNRLFSRPQFNASIIDGDCFKVDPAALGLFDVYLFDGEHVFDSQYRAFTHFAPALRDTFVAIVDDYRNLPEDGVHQATEKAFKDLGWRSERDWFLYDELDGTMEAKQRDGWWNGMRVSVVSKS